MLDCVLIWRILKDLWMEKENCFWKRKKNHNHLRLGDVVFAVPINSYRVIEVKSLSVYLECGRNVSAVEDFFLLEKYFLVGNCVSDKRNRKNSCWEIYR